MSHSDTSGDGVTAQQTQAQRHSSIAWLGPEPARNRAAWSPLDWAARSFIVEAVAVPVG
jgi:hypothetical protein